MNRLALMIFRFLFKQNNRPSLECYWTLCLKMLEDNIYILSHVRLESQGRTQRSSLSRWLWKNKVRMASYKVDLWEVKWPHHFWCIWTRKESTPVTVAINTKTLILSEKQPVKDASLTLIKRITLILKHNELFLDRLDHRKIYNLASFGHGRSGLK